MVAARQQLEKKNHGLVMSGESFVLTQEMVKSKLNQESILEESVMCQLIRVIHDKDRVWNRD